MAERLVLQIDEKGALIVARNVEQIGKSAKSTVGPLQLLKRALGALAAAAFIKQLAAIADEFTNIQNRLRIVTASTEELGIVTQELFEISSRTRADFGATAAVYQKVALASGELGLSQRETLAFTESLNQAVVLSGASAQTAEAGLRQLAQGIGAGALRGDELISVLENLPAVAQIISKELGVSVGQFRQLGSEGKITADIIIQAFRNQAEEIEAAFNKTIPTLSQAFVLLRNSFTKVVGEFDSAVGTTRSFAKALAGLARNLEDVAKSVAILGTAIGVAYAKVALPAAITATRAWGLVALPAATKAVKAFVLALGPIGILASLFAAATAGLVLFKDEIFVTTGRLNALQQAAANVELFFAAMLRQIAVLFDKLADIATGSTNAIIAVFAALPQAIKLATLGKMESAFKLLGLAAQKAFIEGFDREGLTEVIDKAIAEVQAKGAERGASADSARELSKRNQQNRRLEELAAAAGDPAFDTSIGRGGNAGFKVPDPLENAKLLPDKIKYQQDLNLVKEGQATIREELTQTEQVALDVYTSMSNSLLAFIEDGTRSFRDFAAEIFQSLARIAGQLAFQSLGRSLGIQGLNDGGQFQVGGEAGVDKNLVAFNATKGETVTVTPKGESPVPQTASVARPNMNVTIVNVLDPSVVMSALSGPDGEKAILNVISANPNVVSQSIAT